MAEHLAAADPRAGRWSDTGTLQLAMPARQLADAPLTIRVRGVPIGAALVLRLSARWWSGEQLVSSARYRSVDGTIDVSRDAPLEGYAGVDADGLLRTLVPISPPDATGGGRRGASGAVPTTRAGPAADVLEVCARIDAPDATCVSSTTRRDALGPTVATAALPLPGGAATLYRERERTPDGPAVVAVPLLDRAPAERAAALLASHGYVVLSLAARTTGVHLSTVETTLLRAAEQALSRTVSRELSPTVLLGLDLTPDRRSAAATEAWSGLLDRLRDLRVAPSPPR